MFYKARTRITGKFTIGLFVVWILFIPHPTKASDKLILTTGDEAGTYYGLGKAIAEISSKYGVEIKVVPSLGAVENLRRLSSDSADLAFIQNDILYGNYRVEDGAHNQNYEPRAVLSLYTEEVQIVYRGDLSLQKITDLQNKRVSMGPHGSGTVLESKAILESVGLTVGDIHPFYLTFDESLDSLREETIDVAFFSSGLPTPGVSEFSKTQSIEMLSLDPITLERILENCPYFVEATVPANTYEGLTNEIVTVGVRALLVANKKVQTDKIKNLIRAIFSEKKYLIQRCPKAKNIGQLSALDGIADLPKHVGAIAYFSETYIPVKKEIYEGIRQNLPFLFIAFLFLGVVRWRKKIYYYCMKHNLLLALMLVLSVWLISSFILYIAERKINENFESFSTSIYSILVYLFSGFEARIPITSLGKTVGLLALIFGVGISGLYTASLTDIFVKRGLKGGKMNDIQKNGHVIICNWNEKGGEVIKQLRSSDLPLHLLRPILILARNPEVGEHVTDSNKQVYWQNTEPLDVNVLKAAKVHKAHAVIVLADRSLTKLVDIGLSPTMSQSGTNPPHADCLVKIPDMKSSIIISSIRQLCRELLGKDEPGPSISVEMIDVESRELLKRSGADEIVSSFYAVERLLAQTAVSPGITAFFDDLLSLTPETNEVYLVKCPEHFVKENYTFEQVAQALWKFKKHDNPAILVGVKTDGRVIVNPKEREFTSFKAGDELMVIAWTGKGLNEHINRIRL